MRIDVFLESPNRGSSRSKQVLDNGLPDRYLRAVMLEFCECQRQPTPSVGVPDDGIEGCLVKHGAPHAQRIIHGRSSWPPYVEFVPLEVVRGEPDPLRLWAASWHYAPLPQSNDARISEDNSQTEFNL